MTIFLVYNIVLSTYLSDKCLTEIRDECIREGNCLHISMFIVTYYLSLNKKCDVNSKVRLDVNCRSKNYDYLKLTILLLTAEYKFLMFCTYKNNRILGQLKRPH